MPVVGRQPDVLDATVEVEDFDASFDRVFGRLYPLPVRESLRRTLSKRPDRALTLVWEHAYVDSDFTAAYYMQAGRAFMPMARDAQRVHFFSDRVTTEDFDSGEPAAHNKIAAAYLGCVVIRPGAPQSLGRSFIKPPPTLSGAAAVYGTQGRFRVSLMGHKLSVWACPFMSQDGQAFACATAALWMATSSLVGKDEGARAYSTPEITQVANGLHRGFGPRLGSAGLSVDQIERALFEMGYDPLVLDSAKPKRMRDLMVAYADSGFAPVLIVPLRQGVHAMTVVGRIDKAGRIGPVKVGVPAVRGSFSEEIVVHDDQQGMYLRAQVVAGAGRTSKLVFRAGQGALGAALQGGPIQTVIIPVPHRIMADFEAIAARLKEEIRRLRELVGSFEPDHPILMRPIVARPIVVRSREFKERLRTRRGLSPTVRQFYARLPMPRYVWLVELAFGDAALSFGTETTVGNVFGEMLLDSTLPSGASILPLAQHVRNFLVGRAVSGQEYGRDFKSVSRYVTTDTPYSHYVSAAMAQEDW